jgi:carboxylate-amine ligase
MSTYAFRSEYTLGIEEELLLVDRETLHLAPVAGAVLGAMEVDSASAGHEAYAAQIELRSPPSTSVADAVGALAGLRAKAVAAGAVLLGAGLHPTAGLGEVDLVPARRYERVADEMRGLLRRTPESAVHVHVGLPDERTAVSAFNALRVQLPLLQGLSASSPWWFGVDSELASARFVLARAYPGRGVPRALRDLAELDAVTEATLAAAGMPESTFLWWDVRLHPRYGTVEVREMDAQASPDDVAALAALVRALVFAAADAAPADDVPSEALGWSSFRAARDGTAAAILDDGALRPLATVARETVARVRPFARELGDEDALDGIERILEQGGGAGRQRRAHALGGFHEVLATLVADTGGGPPAPLERASRLWLDARSERDLERLAALTARDAVWTSPVDGTSSGRDAVVGHVEAGFRDADAFSTELLAYEARGNRAVARIRNVAARDGAELDSLQALVFEEAGGLVSSIRVHVDDPGAVEAFWADDA